MVKTGQIAIYYGAGKGKTSVSLGKGVRALGENLRVVMIQFMDYHNNQEIALLEKLEPDFRIFHFEKDREGTEMTEEIRKEIASEIRNAFNFTKKILDTGECDMLFPSSPPLLLLTDSFLPHIPEYHLTSAYHIHLYPESFS